MSGAGKSTAARRIAGRLGLEFHEMDALAIGPGWSTPTDFVPTMQRIIARPGWVIDSWGYEAVRDLLWAAADAVVWLDYPRRVVLPRVVRRSVRRTVTAERIFGGNRETVTSWFRRSHPVWHAVRTFGYRRDYLATRTAATPHLTVVRLRGPAEFERWFAELSPCR